MPTPNKGNVGGLIGKVGESGNGMLRIADSHTNGVVYLDHSVAVADHNIGTFIGNADDVYNVGYVESNGLSSGLISNINLNSDNVDSYTYLKKMCVEGLKKRFGNTVREIYKERLKYELEVINKMGFCDYFLIVFD